MTLHLFTAVPIARKVCQHVGKRRARKKPAKEGVARKSTARAAKAIVYRVELTFNTMMDVYRFNSQSFTDRTFVRREGTPWCLAGAPETFRTASRSQPHICTPHHLGSPHCPGSCSFCASVQRPGHLDAATTPACPPSSLPHQGQPCTTRNSIGRQAAHSGHIDPQAKDARRPKSTPLGLNPET